MITLKELRSSKKLTQVETAKYLGIPYNTYRQYEYGITTPPVEILRRMSTLFNKTMDELSEVLARKKVELDSVEAAADRWNVGINRVRKWCQEGAIEGAYLKERWHIPVDATIPSGKIDKKQHYVFRNYLKAWADKDNTSSGRVYVYRKQPKGKQPVTVKALLTEVAFQKYYYDISNYSDTDIIILKRFLVHMQRNQRWSLILNTNLLEDEAMARDFIEKYVMCPVEKLEEKNHFYERLRNGDYSFYKNSVPTEAISKLRNLIVQTIFDQQDHKKEAMDISAEAMKYMYDPDIKYDFNRFFWTQYFRTPKIHDAVATVFDEFKVTAGIENANTAVHVNLFLIFVTEIVAYNTTNRNRTSILLLQNKTNEPFITSDAPIANLSRDKNDAYMYYYPISPYTAMILVFGGENNTTVDVVDVKTIRILNGVTMENAVNEVFSYMPFKVQGDIHHSEGFQEQSGQLTMTDQEEKNYSYNTPQNQIIKELSVRLGISLSDSEQLEKKLEQIGFIEITPSDELIHSNTLAFYYLTFEPRNGLSSTSRNPFNVVIKLKEGMIEELAAAVFGVVSGAIALFDGNKLAGAASLLSSVFSALSLSKVDFLENETAILVALDKRKMNEEDCFIRANDVLRQYGYSEIDQNAFDRALKNLLKYRCVEIIDGDIELCGEIHGTP